mmetsp:Transcript_112344/g.357009  ORF Transcript_112344/g.357009 Transcript_112344/m.357009 type:complete len:1023 (-) Transcript_112344:68-3136(-)
MIAVAAGAAAGASALWRYNRGNFLYDRKLRQEQEYTIFEWRKLHAELWREDVRDIIELTEKKMDNYLIISVLELGMCAGLFACGRQQPGTPPWLLQLYYLTLSGAFTYLLMAVWFAMHATVSAQCASVRMLTQFVRLPIPDWQDFESARTYAQQYETLRIEDVLRVPFMKSFARGDQPAAPKLARGPGYEDWVQEQEDASDGASTAGSSSQQARASGHPDPWRMECNGEDRGFYELRNMTIDMRRHVLLARYAALQYQCFDAFSRLAMSFGTHQLLFALAHFCMGYLQIQEGAHLASWSVVCIMSCVSAMMMHVDFSLTRSEQLVETLLVFTGLISGTVSVHLWSLEGVKTQERISSFLPVAYFAHFSWLLCSLRACGLKETPSGAVLPLKFRAVLYLDVFGWLSRSPFGAALSEDKVAAHASAAPPSSSCCTGRRPSGSAGGGEPDSEPSGGDLSAETSSSGGGGGGGGSNTARPGSMLQRIFGRRHRDRQQPSVFRPSQYAPLDARGDEAAERHDSDRERGGPTRAPGAGGEIGFPPEDAFEPATYQDDQTHKEFQTMHSEEEVETGLDKHGPAKAPARLFKRATYMLAFLWAVSFILPFELFHQLMAKPMVADIYVESIDQQTGLIDEQKEVHSFIGTDFDGMPQIIPIFPPPKKKRPELSGGLQLNVHWPEHSAFVPRALTCAPDGTNLLVADDFGIYMSQISGDFDNPAEAAPVANNDTRSLAASKERDLGANRPSIAFRQAPRCAELEGRTFIDVATLCDSSGAWCRALVLHTDVEGTSSTITSCPLTEKGFGSASSRDAASLNSLQWKIDNDWLEKNERLSSIAVRSSCLHAGASGASPLGSSGIVGAIDTVGRQGSDAGCVIVGTTGGRIVELNTLTDWRDQSILVPKHVFVERDMPSVSGSLADLPGQLLVALWFRSGFIDVVDTRGDLFGQWDLPSHVTWLMAAGGGNNIFFLGVRTPEAAQTQGTRRSAEQQKAATETKQKALVEVWRFPAPPEVQEHWRQMGLGEDKSEL